VNKENASFPTLRLSEWESGLLEGVSLSTRDQRLKQELEQGDEGRLIVDDLRSGVRAKAGSWVGVVRFERFEIQVTPKLAGENLGLVRMIEFATGLDALRRGSSSRTLHAEGIGLFDLLALLLAEASEAILRAGLLSDYVEREDDLPVIRGRLLGDQQILRRFGMVDRLACRFDEHEQNIVENQLLAVALGQCATRTIHESVRRRVRRLLSIFQDVCLDLAAARDQITYNRLNEHYRDAHALAWLLLDGLGTQEIFVSGNTRCFAFLIDMNRLFEMFVYRLIQKVFQGGGYRVHYQRGDRSIILNASTNQPYARVVPDVLVEKVGTVPLARVSVDAKYKLYDERKLGSGDVYQGFLYAYAFGPNSNEALPLAVLVYPSSTKTNQTLRLRIRSAQSLAAAEILALGLSIPDAIAEVTQGARGPATQALIDAIHQGLVGLLRCSA